MKTKMKTIAIGALLACSSLALADEAKPAEKAKQAPPAAGAAAVAPKMPPTPAPPMPEMKPAQEVTDAAKLMVGSYRCKGNDMNPDGSSRPSLASMKISTDLDGYYIVVELSEQKTKDNKTPFKAKMFRTYDAASKKWINTIVAAVPGGPMTMTTADTLGTGRAMWTGTVDMMGQKITEHGYEEPDAKTKSVHIWGEVSMDGGKTFAKDYDMTCKR